MISVVNFSREHARIRRVWLSPSPLILRTAVGTAVTATRSRRGSEGVARPRLLPPLPQRRISFCLQLLHICIFRIALYKHWNVYFHSIAMRSMLFKVNGKGKENGSASIVTAEYFRDSVHRHEGWATQTARSRLISPPTASLFCAASLFSFFCF